MLAWKSAFRRAIVDNLGVNQSKRKKFIENTYAKRGASCEDTREKDHLYRHGNKSASKVDAVHGMVSSVIMNPSSSFPCPPPLSLASSPLHQPEGESKSFEERL